jgi:predicted Zn-dependent peptidase
MINFHKTTLGNKLRIVTIPMKSTEAVTLTLLVGAGSEYEIPEIAGVAHFLEHMFFKGSKKYPKAKQVAESIDSVGGVFNAFTGHDHAGYYIKVAKPHSELAFDLLSDLLLNPKINAAELEREKGVILEEYNMYMDSPSWRISDIYNHLLFEGHPLGQAIIGRPETIGAMTRQKLLNYKQDLYTPDNIVVVVSGAVTLEQSEKLVKKYFQFGNTTKLKRHEIPDPYFSLNNVQVEYKKTDQAHIALGLPAINAFDARRPAFKLISTILGGSMSSRLWGAIRERQGLAYYVNTYGETMATVGTLVTYAGIRLNAVEKAVTIIKQEYEKLASQKITEKELRKAKELRKGRLLLGLEDSDEVAYAYGLQELLFGKIEKPSAQIERFESVTAAEIKALMSELYQPNKLKLAVVGPFKSSTHKQFAALLTK